MGDPLGCNVGAELGAAVGARVGAASVGEELGVADGVVDGAGVGRDDGTLCEQVSATAYEGRGERTWRGLTRGSARRGSFR